jgi:tRNA pseudouridine32 synthase / 23S rRNA pseudouridine746 synthase
VTPRVIYADADVVVVDKPSGMPSVPARTPLDPADVAPRLATAYGPLEAAHRLDRDTSGLLVLARSRAARAALGRAFEAREVAKRYLAVVIGRPADTSGEMCLPLAADRDHPPRQRIDLASGKPATTRWRLLAVAAGPAETPALSLLEVEPLTGRSHQIRVHLADLGCPIAGDRLYGGTAADVRLALHAAHLDLPHPASGERLRLTVSPPSEPPWNRFAAAVTAALAAWPNGSPSASSGRSGPGR